MFLAVYSSHTRGRKGPCNAKHVREEKLWSDSNLSKSHSDNYRWLIQGIWRWGRRNQLLPQLTFWHSLQSQHQLFCHQFLMVAEDFVKSATVEKRPTTRNTHYYERQVIQEDSEVPKASPVHKYITKTS